MVSESLAPQRVQTLQGVLDLVNWNQLWSTYRSGEFGANAGEYLVAE